MKKVLVTGARGFIGRQCLPLLAAKEYEIHAVSSQAVIELNNDIHWHQSDLLDKAQAESLFRQVKPSHLLHLAWCTESGDYRTSEKNLHWLKASIDLLYFFEKNGGQKALVAGTCAEYDWRYGFCSEFLTPLMPMSLYGASKHSLQIISDAFARQTNLHLAWGRIFYLYGPFEPPQRIVPYVIRSLLKGKTTLCSHGDQIRDYMYVADVADALVTALDSEAKGPINIASGAPVAIKDIIVNIADQLNRPDLIQFGAIKTNQNDPPMLAADISRLSNEVGWRFKYSLNQGLELTIRWWKNRNEDNY